MGLFDGMLGGVVGGTMASVINNFLEQHGGVQGVVSQFEQKGFGPTVRSWVGTGPNEPINATQIQHVIGSDTIQQLAQKAGLSAPDLTAKLAQLLPQAIDHLTPGGSIPKAG